MWLDFVNFDNIVVECCDLVNDFSYATEDNGVKTTVYFESFSFHEDTIIQCLQTRSKKCDS